MTQDEQNGVEDLVHTIIELAQALRAADPSALANVSDGCFDVLTAIAISALQQGVRL